MLIEREPVQKPNRLPVLRERLNELLGGMSSTEFAKKIGLSRQTVGFYLNGDRIPDSETLLQICEKCGVSADWLLGLAKEKTSIQVIEGVNEMTAELSIDDDDITIPRTCYEDLIRCQTVLRIIDRVGGQLPPDGLRNFMRAIFTAHDVIFAPAGALELVKNDA